MVPLIGYPDRISVAAGETIRFMVSSSLEEDYEARLVRIVCADANPHGPGFREEEVAADGDGRYRSKYQPTWLGSHVSVADAPPLARLAGFSLDVLAWPTTPGKGRQGVLTQWDSGRGAGFALLVDADGTATLELGDGSGGIVAVSTGRRLNPRIWSPLPAGYDPDRGLCWVEQAPLKPVPKVADAGRVEAAAPAGCFAPAGRPLLIAALDVRDGDGQARVGGHYNGKLERPRIAARKDGRDTALAEWDFSRDIPSTSVIDIGPHRLGGQVVNLPARAMTGSNWTGAVVHWTEAPEQYGAIHFHDDDIYDCGWTPEVSITIPAEARQGFYALRLTGGGRTDRIPFIVRRPRDRMTSDALLLVSTFTYYAYCNYKAISLTERTKQRAVEWGAWSDFAHDHLDYGHSLYDTHSDGSGVCYTSRLRPNLNMRPTYMANDDPKGSALRHYNADTWLSSWLEHIGQDVDFVTDEDLHAEGLDLIRGYRAILTCSHPEYHTPTTRFALQDYVETGGRLMYLGGNGFYWKISHHPILPGVYELRRAEGGIRTWAAEPGEYYHSFDGSYGGMWRRNGHPPQELGGVGFTSQGNYEGSYYRRRPESQDPRVGFIFEGIGADELIGDFGFGGGGAAGFELDRADPLLGTPGNCLIVASSEGHGDLFRWVNEEMLRHVPHKPREEVIRADIVFFEKPQGGAVFATGSITYSGALPYNGYENNVATLTGNVLRRFLDPTPF